MLLKKQFNTAPWGDPRNGYIAFPDDRTKKYPLEIYFHGLGQTVDGLINEGPLAKIKNGAAPQHITLALSGDGRHAGYAPEIPQYWYVMQTDPDIKALWDGINILWTGLSAGGLRVLEAIQQKMPGVFAPMSPVGIDSTKVDFTQKYKAWFFHSSNDANPGTPYKVSTDFVAKLNAAFPGSARLTTTTTGHSGWNPLFEFGYRDPVYNENLYQWAWGTSPAPVPAPPKKLLFTLKVFEDGSTEKV